MKEINFDLKCRRVRYSSKEKFIFLIKAKEIGNLTKAAKKYCVNIKTAEK